jgi:hypothetical protein
MRCVEPWLAGAALLLAGCAGLRAPGVGEAAPLFRDPALTPDSAARLVAVGRSNRREVEQALGPAERLAFDSGYEVWVYRAKDAPAGARGAELVILFDPQGRVGKLRARPADAARPR